MVRPRFLHLSLDELIYRFEEPTPEARWHRPLFTTTTTGSPNAPERFPTPLEELWEAITQAKVQPPKAVTLVRKKTTNNSLELLDSVTQAVLGAISEYRAQGGAMCGNIPLSLPQPIPPPPIVFACPPLNTFPSPARLQTLRRQFVRVYAGKAEYADGLALTSQAEPERYIAQMFTAWLQETLTSNNIHS